MWKRIKYRDKFTILAEEAKIIIYNLILYLWHKYGDEVLLYFTEEVKQEVKEDKWDKEK